MGLRTSAVGCYFVLCSPESRAMGKTRKIKGTVVLMKKNVLDLADYVASFIDRTLELFCQRVTLRLVSAVHCEPGAKKGKVTKPARLQRWLIKIASIVAAKEVKFSVTFDWDVEDMGIPGALLIRNRHFSQFYLNSVTLHDVPGQGEVYFICNSWVYPAKRYPEDRIFFTNRTYLPSKMPEPLKYYRNRELLLLQGNGSGELKEWERVYDYAYYNDLGQPEKGSDYARPVLGGSQEFPYPRRARTGRKPNKADPNTESRLPLVISLGVYVPRDERFNHVKLSDFLAYAIKSVGQVIYPELLSLFDKTINEFDSFQDVLKLYEGGIKLPGGGKLRNYVPLELIKELLRTDGERFLKFPMPGVIKEDKSAWRTDEEFGREMVAGVNPVCISRLQEFPPTSTLDPNVYGDQTSTITKELIEPLMNGLTVEQAIKDNKLFILNHHDSLMPYLSRINTTSTKTYASRTILLLQNDGTLKPLAIELSLPHPQGDQYGCTSQVYTAAQRGVESTIWQLAKAYAAVNDSGVHQLISHWLNTHAVIEPFIIAANRQMSVVHPIFKLLHPHFRDTLYINALARAILISAGGVLESTVFPAKYAMEMCAVIYKGWIFTEQALPAELLKRGIAVPDETQPCGVKLLIEDYPYAVDGLEIWAAIEEWVTEYCNYYYPTDDIIRGDVELQLWWEDVRTKGHGDKKDEPWWPKMQTKQELVTSCTTIIWIASALHAAINFGQYPYAGYLPNRPTVSRRFMPAPGSPEYAELETNPDVAFLKTITAQFQTLLGVSLIEILSRHSSDEIYLGQRDSDKWTTDAQPLESFQKFGRKLVDIENRIMARNKDRKLLNRCGPAQLPYTLLYPAYTDSIKALGLTGMGIPNSVSI
ncbi:Linoleate 9S-lipoxygenase [Bertholletia excelsa]